MVPSPNTVLCSLCDTISHITWAHDKWGKTMHLVVLGTLCNSICFLHFFWCRKNVNSYQVQVLLPGARCQSIRSNPEWWTILLMLGRWESEGFYPTTQNGPVGTLQIHRIFMRSHVLWKLSASGPQGEVFGIRLLFVVLRFRLTGLGLHSSVWPLESYSVR